MAVRPPAPGPRCRLGLAASALSLVGVTGCGGDDPARTGADGSSASADAGVPADPALFDYEDDGEVAMRELDAQAVGPVTVREVTYPSPRGGAVTATLTAPRADADDAAVLLLHGMPLDRDDMRLPALVYACAGATTLAIDAPYARHDRGSISFTPRDRDDQVQLITDLRRGIDLLDQEVAPAGPAHVSLVGLSYGAAMGALLVGVDDRVGSAALIVGDGGLVAHMTDDDGAPTGELASLPDTEAARWLEAMRPVEPLLYVGASDASLLFLNGRHDTQVEVADAEQLHAAAGDDSEVRWYDTGHDLTAGAYRHQFTWVGQQAGLDPARLTRCVEDHAELDSFS